MAEARKTKTAFIVACISVLVAGGAGAWFSARQHQQSFAIDATLKQNVQAAHSADTGSHSREIATWEERDHDQRDQDLAIKNTQTSDSLREMPDVDETITKIEGLTRHREFADAEKLYKEVSTKCADSCSPRQQCTLILKYIDILCATKRNDQSIALYQKCIDILQRHSEEDTQLAAFVWLGYARQEDRTDHDRALDCYEHCISIFDKIHYDIGYREWLEFGKIYQTAKQWGKATDYLQRCLAKARGSSAPDVPETALEAYVRLYEVYRDSGDYASAQKAMEDLLKNKRAARVKTARVFVERSVAEFVVHGDSGMFEQFATQMAKLAEATGRKDIAGDCYKILADHFQTRSDFVQALALSDKAVHTYDADDRPLALHSRGLAKLGLKQLDGAVSDLLDALEGMKRSNRPQALRIEPFVNAADVKLVQGKADECISLCTDELKGCPKKDKIYRGWALRKIGDAYRLKQDERNAVKYLSLAIDELGNSTAGTLCHYVRAQIYLQTKQPNDAINDISECLKLSNLGCFNDQDKKHLNDMLSEATSMNVKPKAPAKQHTI